MEQKTYEYYLLDRECYVDQKIWESTGDRNGLSGQETGSQELLELKTAEESGLAAILERSSRAERETKGTNQVRAAAS